MENLVAGLQFWITGPRTSKGGGGDGGTEGWFCFMNMISSCCGGWLDGWWFVVCNHHIVSVYFWLKYFLFRFDMTQFIAKARIALNANYILSSWVYLDDLDTSKNVLYVGVFIFIK